MAMGEHCNRRRFAFDAGVHTDCKTMLYECPLPRYSPLYKLHELANATLNTAEIYEATKPPPGLTVEAWIASNIVSIHDELIWVATIFADFCNPQSDLCCVMHAGTCHYRWQEPGCLPVDMPAVQYTDRVVQDGYDKIKANQLIPHDAVSFPADFLPQVRVMLKRFFRVYAHVYTCHFEDMRAMDIEAHVNMMFKRMLFVSWHLNLVNMEDIEPLRAMATRFLQEAEIKSRMKAYGL